MSSSYKRFIVDGYKAVKQSPITIHPFPIPLIGVNESGKSSVLEAITRFDFRNDALATAKGWGFRNRYIPADTDFSITAEINLAPDDLKLITDPLSGQQQAEITPLLDSETEIVISRKFATTDATNLYALKDVANEATDAFARRLIERLPRIFYFDNFLENQLPDTVAYPSGFATGSDSDIAEHQAVVYGMFQSSGLDLGKFFSETDQRTKATYLSEVNSHVTERMIADWRTMHVKGIDIDAAAVKDIRVELVENRDIPNAIDIQIVETFRGTDGRDHSVTMLLGDRSLGFRWFFNFTAKKAFGAVGQQRFVYLLDEPGSFLHNSAQSILLDALIDLAKTHPVIYATHSEFLLDPERINLNAIRIARKSDREVRLIAYAEIGERMDLGALTPLHNALRIKAPIGAIFGQDCLVTEGITDFYFWRMLSVGLVILPGFGAGSSEYLLSIAIGSAKRYLALFDDDDAGRRAITKYKRKLGDEEAVNWKYYVDRNGNGTELESLLSASDQNALRTKTGVNDLKKAITILYFGPQEDRRLFWEATDMETRANINSVISVLRSALAADPPLRFQYGFGV